MGLLYHIVNILLIILLVLTILFVYDKYANADNCGTRIESEVDVPSPESSPGLNPGPIDFIDPVKAYDIDNYTNPFAYPTTRPTSEQFRPLINNPLFYWPTRGYPDEPAYVGNLVEERERPHHGHNGHNGQQEEPVYNPQLPSVLQLMGFQKYSRADRYEYYVLLPSTGTNPPIKFPISNRNQQEIFDGDRVGVMGKHYIFRKNKSPFEYYI